MATTTEHLDIPIVGMTCASCANRIEKNLNKLDGVEASVNFATEKATVDFDPHEVDTEALAAAVEAAGYQAVLPAVEPEALAHETRDDPTASLRQRLVMSALLSAPVLVLTMVPALQFDYWQWLSLQLATPVVLWGGWPFHRAAWQNLRRGAATMDTLISIGTLAAFMWSLYELFLGDAGMPGMKMGFDLIPEAGGGTDEIYLEVAAVVTTFALAGRYFEARAKRRAGTAIAALMELGTKEVSVLDHDGTERLMPIEEVAPGQRFVVRPGEKVATDGVVEEGSSAVDMSMLTGESVPVEVSPGSEVAGASVNAGGRLVVRATKVGSETALAQIAKLVTDAQTGKAPVQRLADRISGIFVPVVIAIAAVTLGFWLGAGEGTGFAITAAVAVLIIACPCALGLATPTALMVGTGGGAQLGLLIKGPEILESTRSVETIVLDKTGTVTTGRMSLTDVFVAESTDRAEALRLVGAVENGSEHPIARAIADAARAEFGQLPEVEGFANQEGLGVIGSVDGHDLLVGRALPGRVGDAARAGARGRVRGGAGPGPHRDRRRLGRSRPGALRGRGHDQADERGGRREPEGTRSATGASYVRQRDDGAGGRPRGRDRRGDRRGHALGQGGRHQAAPVRGTRRRDGWGRRQRRTALAEADLGISIGTGTDVAIEASDLTAVSGDLRAAADAIRLSRSTLRTIKQNLASAFGYNLAALPLAAVGLLNPLIAAATMAFSSVSVVGNALRLRRFRARPPASGQLGAGPD